MTTHAGGGVKMLSLMSVLRAVRRWRTERGGGGVTCDGSRGGGETDDVND